MIESEQSEIQEYQFQLFNADPAGFFQSSGNFPLSLRQGGGLTIHYLRIDADGAGDTPANSQGGMGATIILRSPSKITGGVFNPTVSVGTTLQSGNMFITANSFAPYIGRATFQYTQNSGANGLTYLIMPWYVGVPTSAGLPNVGVNYYVLMRYSISR